MRFMRYSSCPLLWMVSWNESIVNAPHLYHLVSEGSRSKTLQAIPFETRHSLLPKQPSLIHHIFFCTPDIQDGSKWYPQPMDQLH